MPVPGRAGHAWLRRHPRQPSVLGDSPVGWGYAAVLVDGFGPRNIRWIYENANLFPTPVRWTPTTPLFICTPCPTSRPTGSESLASPTVAGRPFGPRSRNAFLSVAAAARFRRQSPIAPHCQGERWTRAANRFFWASKSKNVVTRRRALGYPLVKVGACRSRGRCAWRTARMSRRSACAG